MNQLKIDTRLRLLVAVSCLFVMIAGAAGILGLRSVMQRLDTVYEDRTLALGHLSAVLESAQALRVHLHGELPAPESSSSKAGASIGLRSERWRAYMATRMTAEERGLAIQADKQVGLLARDADAVALAGQRRDAPGSETARFGASLDALIADLHSLIELQPRVAKQQQRAAQQDFAVVVAVITISILACLLVGMMLSWLLMRALRKQRLSQRLIQEVIDEYPAIVFVKDMLGRLILTNRAYERFFALPRGAALGKTDFDIIPHDAALRVRANDAEVLSTGGIKEVEEEVLGADGPRIFQSTKFPLTDDAGVPHSICGIAVDITDRREAEKCADKATEQLRALWDRSPDCYLFITHEGIVDVNEAAVKLYGVSSKTDLIGRRLSDPLISPATQPGGQDSIELGARTRAFVLGRLVSGGDPPLPEGLTAHIEGDVVHVQWQHLRGGKTPFFAEIVMHGIQLRNQDGVLAIVRDVTRRKLAEDSLKESEAFNKLLFQGSHRAMVVYDPGGAGFIDCNEAAVKVYGYARREEVLGKTPLDVSDPTQYDGTDSATAIERYDRAALTKGMETFEWRHRRPNGETWDAMVHLMAFSHRGKQILQFTLDDVTESRRSEAALRESEERLSLAIEGGDLATWQYDMKTAKLTGSDRNFAMFGIPGDAPISIEGFYELVHRKDRAHLEAAIQEAKRTGRISAEYRVFLPTGETRWLATRGRIYFDADGGPLHVSGTTQDVTALMQAKEDLSQAKAAADAANAAKSQFLANMSHEIRTPMNAILGMSHLALKDSADPAQRAYLDKIQRAGQHLLSIISDILDISKVEAGKLTIEQSYFTLSQLLGDVASVVGDKVEEKGLQIQFDVASDVPAALMGDRLRLGQVLINYATNAVKFTDRGGIRISVGVDQRDERDMLLRFTVRDTGIGLDLDQVGLIFEAFQQGDSSTTRKYEGAGLGLAICKNLVELMGGEVGVDSELGRGSTFWFTARLGRGELQLDAEELPATVRGRRILVAECHGELSRMLTGMGFTVATVCDGRSVLAAFKSSLESERPFDVVVLDLDIPRLDGPSVVERIRAYAPSRAIRLIAVASAKRMESVMQTGDVGGVRLIKPIEPSRMIDSVVGMIGASEEAPAGPTQEEGGHGALIGRRVLLVEDNDFNQEVARAVLSDAGLQVDVADDGAIAVGMAQAQAYDIILMDMQMPVMDGLTATREIRRLLPEPRVPILAMTANVMQEDRKRCADAGMDDFVAKPIDPDELLDLLAEWIGRHQPRA
ncbi:response regulator [Lysobacter antibioticus]|uniref:response regulator n=1 Tax=Lysobacter antibioticus TaxID=84531 RepID=UPI0009E8C923|nr:response regulator [Lysobacter antibioticus]